MKNYISKGRFNLLLHAMMISSGVYLIKVSPQKLKPCGDVRTNDLRMSNEENRKWFKWAQLYSFCKQYDFATKSVSPSFDQECSSLECSQCLAVCYMEEENRNSTACGDNCTSSACMSGCHFLLNNFDEKRNNVTFHSNTSTPYVSNATFQVTRNIDSVKFSWTPIYSHDQMKISSIYLVTILANKGNVEYILGLVQDNTFLAGMGDMCENVYSGYQYEQDLMFSLVVYPINFNGPKSAKEAQISNIMIKSEFVRPLYLPVVNNLTISSGSPFFEASDTTAYDYIKWKIEWEKPVFNSSKGIRFTKNIASCSSIQDHREITHLNDRHHIDVSNEGPAFVTISNTKDDKLSKCTIKIYMRIKHGDCFLGKQLIKEIQYGGCKEVKGYKNPCSGSLATLPPINLIDTVVYDINATVIGRTCDGSFEDTCIHNNNLTCNYCNRTKYDIRVDWSPLQNVFGIRSYKVRWGTFIPPMNVMIDEESEVLDTVGPNNTTYLIEDIYISDDLILGIQVHAETFLSQPNWRLKFNSIIRKELYAHEPVPISPTLQPKTPTTNNMATVIAVVVVLLFTAMCFIVIVVIYRRRVNNKKRHFYNEEIKLEEKTIVADDWEIYPSSITMDEKIGEGAFGNVYSATMETSELMKTDYAKHCSGNKLMCENIKVAVKFLKESAQDMEYNDFHEEIILMKSIGYHEHIVNMIGCSTITKPLCLIIEFMHHGDLLHYMRKYRTGDKNDQSCAMAAESDDITENCLSPQDVMSFAWQIASGMEYLSTHNVVHRDLAARNILINNEKKIKISDFGLSRYVSDELIYVSRNKMRKLPVKWMSIEAIYHQEFTTASDVWAYGVVLFEIVTLGGTPYPSVGNRELCKMLKSGYRMDKPENCDETVYDIMLHCWNEIPSERPTFTELREHVESLVEKGDMYFSFDIDENEQYYNVASFKSIPSDDDDDELFTKEYEEKPIYINNKPSDASVKHDPKLDDLRVDIDSDRYVSPQSIKVITDADKYSSFDNPTFDTGDNCN